MPDPAELETEQRKAAGAVAFDRLVEANLGLVTSNVQLVGTVRAAIWVVTACAVLSMVGCTFMMFSMRATMGEMRAMLQTILDALPLVRP